MASHARATCVTGNARLCGPVRLDAATAIHAIAVPEAVPAQGLGTSAPGAGCCRVPVGHVGWALGRLRNATV